MKGRGLPAVAALVAALVLAGCASRTERTATAATPALDVAPSALALQQQFVQVVKQVGPAVVLIRTDEGLGSGTDPQLGSGQAPGIGFAIPSNTVRDIATQLIRTGTVTSSHRAYLGVDVAATTGGELLVTNVQANGPAARAGIAADELIAAVGGTATPDPATLSDVLAGLNPGQHVTVAVIRPDGTRRTVLVTLGQYPG